MDADSSPVWNEVAVHTAIFFLCKEREGESEIKFCHEHLIIANSMRVLKWLLVTYWYLNYFRGGET